MIRRNIMPKSQSNQDPAISLKRGEIDVEQKRRELYELQAEEVAIQLEEVKESMADLEDETLLTAEVQKQWHQEALRTFCEDRRFEVRKLKKRAADLEKKQQEG